MNADEAFERAAHVIEHRSGNAIYRKAWRAAAKVIRGMKSNSEVNCASAEVNPQHVANQIDGKLPGSR
jgi:hypothetical protein